MTMKKKGIIAALGVLVLLASILIYWNYFYNPTPDPFPDEEQLIEEINGVYPEAKASKIQDRLFVDENHVVVPFLSKENNYSLSYWVWEEHRWKVDTIETKGEPKIWKLDNSDPSPYVFVWNIDPRDQVDSIVLYFVRDRNFHISEGIDNYFPRIQMEKKVSLREKSYGAMPLPDDWAAVANSLIKVARANQSHSLMNDLTAGQVMFFGWTPKDQSGKDSFPRNSVNGSGFTNGKLAVDHMMILDSTEVE